VPQDDQPGPAEITQPLPAVEPAPAQAPPAARPGIDQPTTALPLIDLLAPKQADPSPTTAMPPGAIPPAATPPAGMPPVVAPMPPMAGSGTGPLPSVLGPVAGPAPPPRRPRQLGWPVVAIGAAAALVLGLLGWLAFSSTPTTGRPGATSTAPTTPIRVADGYQFTQRAAQTDTDCAGNSYGQVADFFRGTPCTRLQRYLYTSSVDGRPVVVSVSAVQMADEQAATALKKLADTDGTGNVADLLRAGVRVPGVPDALSDASYASTRDGSMVVIVESDYADPAQRADAGLERLSDAAVQLGAGGG
jgi:hypothetical protein